jgi:hypothetical protein
VASPAGEPRLGPAESAAVRAKIGLAELEQVRAEATAGGTRLTFCLPAGHGPADSRIEVVYIGWMDPRLVRRGVKPLRLLEVAKGER